MNNPEIAVLPNNSMQLTALRAADVSVGRQSKVPVTDRLERSLDRLADYSDEALLAELRRLAAYLGTHRISIRDIDNHGRCSYALLKQRFGGLARRNVLRAFRAGW